jgi:hypothetical protein
VLDGAAQEEAARIGGVGRQTMRDGQSTGAHSPADYAGHRPSSAASELRSFLAVQPFETTQEFSFEFNYLRSANES